jgi:hypothetical protein
MSPSHSVFLWFISDITLYGLFLFFEANFLLSSNLVHSIARGRENQRNNRSWSGMTEENDVESLVSLSECFEQKNNMI